ncbi:hypothetical protein OIU84_021178 [Salix udensis]|uniref:Uncharacterized protein n=1 Tax=Salix udensis TaxID=889485 RepID=A0AAD6KW62_9ROSI|nr:hypothetical protein OIU84_021178 [Salix udensis]
MAIFSSFSQAKYLSFISITGVLFIIFLLVNSCSAARPGAALMRGEDMSQKSENTKPYRRLYDTSFQHRNHIFNFLPKGVPTPPSVSELFKLSCLEVVEWDRKNNEIRS